MIIHLGKNPRNGGNPPKESKVIKIINFIKKFEFNILKVWLMLNSLKLLNMKIVLIFKMI